MSQTIDRFMPTADVRERHEIIVRAPAALVFDVAEHLELESIAIARAIFWLRSKLLGTRYERLHKRLVEETLGIGWGKVAYTPGCELVMGSVTQPWFGEVKFRALRAYNFAAFEEPELVKLAWKLEVEPLGSEVTRFPTQARVLATDEEARKNFKRYWRRFGVGNSRY